MLLGKNNYEMRYNFLKLCLWKNTIVSFPEAVRDNVISNDVTIYVIGYVVT